MDPSPVIAEHPDPGSGSPAPGAPLRNLRLAAAGTVVTLVTTLVILIIAGLRATAVDTLWVALPVVLGLADAALLPAMGATVRTLPYGMSGARARRAATAALRALTLTRLALAETPALFGLVATLAAHSLLPFAVGTAFSLPLLLRFGYPWPTVVAAVRRRLEADGTRSGL